MVKNITELLEHIKINDHIIKLEKNKQLRFRLIYNLKLVELKIIKTYIKINLANDLIQLFKSPIQILIFFGKKPNNSL